MMDPVFPNSAVVSVPERFILGGGRFARVQVAVRYGVFRHPRLGLTLIDTGYGPQVTAAAGRSLALRAYAGILRIRLREEGAPAAVLQRMGYCPKDVDTVIATHFHADHVARLSEFPRARILASAEAYVHLMRLPRRAQLHHGFFAELLPADFRMRLMPLEDLPPSTHPDLGSCRDLGGNGDLLAVDLPGHALGHFGVLFPHLAQPLLYAVDTQWHRAAIREGRPPGLPASAVYADRNQAMASVHRVLGFAQSGGRVVLCHDPAIGAFGMEVGNDGS